MMGMRAGVRGLLLGFPPGASGASAANPLDALLAQFEGGEADAGVWRSDYLGGYRAYLGYRVEDSLYYTIRVTGGITEGSNALMQKMRVIQRLHSCYNQTTATFGGTGWATNTNASHYGGNYSTTSATGAYIQFTTAAPVTHIGIFIDRGVERPLMAVTLTNSEGAPVSPVGTKIKTAQAWVDGGTFAATHLTTGGGTIDPATYILPPSLSGASINALGEIISGLPSDVYTLRLTHTGYNLAGAVIAHFLHAVVISGFGYAGASFGLSSTSFKMIDALTLVTEQADDISYNHWPTGATSSDWIGHLNYTKAATGAPVLTVDGVETALDDGDVHLGTTLRLSQQQYGRHDDMGTTNTADITMYWEVNPTTGHTWGHTIKWLTGGSVTGYPFMAQLLLNPFDRIAYLGAGADTALVGDNTHGKMEITSGLPDHAFAWDANGEWAHLAYVPDVATSLNNYADVGASWFVEVWDQTTAPKLYFARCNSYTYIQDETWVAALNSRMKRFPGGANAVLTQAP